MTISHNIFMATQTKRYGFRKPDYTDQIDVMTDINNNLDKIDNIISRKREIARFKNDGTFNRADYGLTLSSAIDIVLVGGGGGGAGWAGEGGGGGGAGGGVLFVRDFITADATYSYKIGVGGEAGTCSVNYGNNGKNGGNTTFGTLSVTGGMGGIGAKPETGEPTVSGGGSGQEGGSGGGGGARASADSGHGGDGGSHSRYGEDFNKNVKYGRGGPVRGVISTSNGIDPHTGISYGNGGGGGAYGDTSWIGGRSVYGAGEGGGGLQQNSGQDGVVNTGGGGGGGRAQNGISTTGGKGGSGVIIIYA